MSDVHDLVRERVGQLPDQVWDCEGCNQSQSMVIRRSSLRPDPCADDVTLKCEDTPDPCHRTRTHGIPIPRETFEQELELRSGRILDFVHDGPMPDVEDNLAALGYIDR